MTTNLTSYKAGTALAPIARSATVTLIDQYGDTWVGSSGTNVQFTGEALGRVASTANGSNDLNTGANVTGDDGTTAVGLDVGDKIVITEVGAGAGDVFKEDCTYTVKTRTDLDTVIVKVVAGDLGTTTSTLTTTGCAVADPVAFGADASSTAVGAWLFNRTHDTFTFADRAVGPDGTANIAWNDANTGAANTGVGAYVAALGNSAPSKTSYRYIAPAAVDLENSQTTTVWTTTAGSDLVDADGDVGAQILEWDNANNTLLIRLDYTGATCSLFSLLAALGCNYTITKYSYDDNDQFNLTADATAAATSLAGFELTLTGHLNAADGEGGAVGGFARGDLDTVSYAALAANVSVFSLGG
jgi:hypothetical protein